MKNKLYFILLSIVTTISLLSTIALVTFTIYAYQNASIIAFISGEWW